MAKGGVEGDISDWEGTDLATMKQAFTRAVKVGAKTSGSTDAINLSALSKMIPSCKKKLEEGIFSAATRETAKKLPLSKFLTKDFFIKMCGSEDQAKKIIKEVQDKERDCQAKEGQPTKKGSDVTSRLTDTSAYTGSHKGRFDKDGKGRGRGGREDLVKDEGYVGGYKGANTYDKTH